MRYLFSCFFYSTGVETGRRIWVQIGYLGDRRTILPEDFSPNLASTGVSMSDPNKENDDATVTSGFWGNQFSNKAMWGNDHDC